MNANRDARQGRIDKLTEMLAAASRELNELKGQQLEGEPEAELAWDPIVEYGQLFNQWLHDQARPVLTHLSRLTAEQLKAVTEANHVKADKARSKAEMVAAIRGALEAQKKEARQAQYYGLCQLLQSEWNYNNRDFVEGRLYEYTPAQLKEFCAGFNIKVAAGSRQEAAVKAVLDFLEANRPREKAKQPKAGPSIDPEEEKYRDLYQSAFDDWHLGRRQKVMEALGKLSLEQLKAFFRLNDLPVQKYGGKASFLAALPAVLDARNGAFLDDRRHGFYDMLLTEWGVGNRSFLERRLTEKGIAEVRAICRANKLKIKDDAGLGACIKAIKIDLAARTARKKA
jgi:hypothetical protein